MMKRVWINRAVTAGVIAASMLSANGAFAQYPDISEANDWIDWITSNLAYILVCVAFFIVLAVALWQRSLEIFVGGIAIVTVIALFIAHIPDMAGGLTGAG